MEHVRDFFFICKSQVSLSDSNRHGMGYIPLPSLENLKKYSYRSVDRCAHEPL